MKASNRLLAAAGVAAAISVLCFFWSGYDENADQPRPVAAEKPARVEPVAHTVADRTNSSRILFLSHRSGRNVLYTMDPDGSEPKPVFGGELEGMPGLADGTLWYREPHWSRQSPDGRFFLSYALDRGLPPQRFRMPPRFLIHLGRMEGGPTRLITPDGGEVFAWAPDSQRFAYARSLWGHPATLSHPVEPRTQLVVAAIDGSDEKILLDRPGLWIPDDWSPDGSRLLVSYMSSPILQKSSAALLELDITAAEAVAKASGLQTRRPEQGDHGKTPEGPGLRTILPSRRGIAPSAGRYSPDGKTIAMLGSTLIPESEGLIDPSRFAASFELRLLELSSGASLVILREPDLFGGPISWSPDGRQILCARYDRHEQAVTPDREPPGDIMSIWSIDREGGGLRRLTGGWSPDWRPAPAETFRPGIAASSVATIRQERSVSPPAPTPGAEIHPEPGANALKQFGLGLANFQQARASGKVAKRSQLPVNQQVSWIVAALPQLGRGDLYDRIHSMVTDGDDRPWNDASNRAAVAAVLDPLVTPDMATSGVQRDASGAGLTGIVGVSGTGPDSPALPEGSKDPARGFFGYHRISRLADVSDGTSSTVMLMEVRSRLGPWAQNGPSTVRPIESFEGGLVLMADGSVRSLARSTDQKLLRSLSTIAASD